MQQTFDHFELCRYFINEANYNYARKIFEPRDEKTARCICENKVANQLCSKLISGFVFA